MPCVTQGEAARPWGGGAATLVTLVVAPSQRAASPPSRRPHPPRTPHMWIRLSMLLLLAREDGGMGSQGDQRESLRSVCTEVEDVSVAQLTKATGGTLDSTDRQVLREEEGMGWLAGGRRGAQHAAREACGSLDA